MLCHGGIFFLCMKKGGELKTECRLEFYIKSKYEIIQLITFQGVLFSAVLTSQEYSWVFTLSNIMDALYIFNLTEVQCVARFLHLKKLLDL